MDDEIIQEVKEDFHEFLRGYIDIFINNDNNIKYYTHKNLKDLIKKSKYLCYIRL